MASFAPPRFQLARRAAVDLSDKIYHAVKLDVNGELVLATSGDDAIAYGMLINNPVLGEFGEVSTFGGGAKAKLFSASTAVMGPLKISSTPGQLQASSSTELAMARALEAGAGGDVIEIEQVLFRPALV